MKQLSNKIQIPDKIIFATLMILFLSFQWGIAVIPDMYDLLGSDPFFCIWALTIAMGCFLSVILLFLHRRLGWYLGILFVSLDIINSIFTIVRIYNDHTNQGMAGFAVGYGKILIFFDLIILLLLFFGRKNYFAATNKNSRDG